MLCLLITLVLSDEIDTYRLIKTRLSWHWQLVRTRFFSYSHSSTHRYMQYIIFIFLIRISTTLINYILKLLSSWYATLHYTKGDPRLVGEARNNSHVKNIHFIMFKFLLFYLCPFSVFTFFCISACREQSLERQLFSFF